MNFQIIGLSQKDSLSVNAELGIRGRWQTGNLNQLGLNPDARLLLSNTKIALDFRASYQYLRVERFTAISDFWTSGLISYTPTRRFFPILAGYYGFAKSYKIDQSLFVGTGAGSNIINKSNRSFLQIHAFVGYFQFEFEEQDIHSTFAIGSIMKAAIPLGKPFHITWQLDTYHATFDSDLWGASNVIMINYQISKKLFLNLSHNTIFNNQSATNIKKVNTLMMFGIRYQS